MKLTVRQLQQYVEEQLEKMTIRLERAERHYSELHDRIDRMLLRMEKFQEDTRTGFSDSISLLETARDDAEKMRIKFEKNFLESQQEYVSLLSILNESFTEVSRHQNAADVRLDRLEKR